MKRPAEFAGVSGSLALLVGYLFGVTDTETLVAVGFVVGLIPAAVTLLVANGGVRGVVRKLWAGGAREGGLSLVEVTIILLAVAVVALLVEVF